MQEMGTDYTPHIQYITDTENISLICDNVHLLEKAPFNYERLFRFVNFNFEYFTSDLNAFYNIEFENINEFHSYFWKTNEYLKQIFSISHVTFTRTFLQMDYTEHSRHKILDASTREDIKQTEKHFLQFMENLYNIQSLDKTVDGNDMPPICDDTYTENYFKDYFKTNILSYTQVQGSIPTIITSNMPPHNLLLLQKKLLNYFSWDITRNEYYRLKYQNQQTDMEFRQLIETVNRKIKASKKDKDNNKNKVKLSLSERTALKLEKDRYSFTKTYPNKSYDNLFSSKEITSPGVPPYKLTYWENINTDFSHISSTLQENAYTFNHIEGILFLDMHYFIKSKHFTFQCPNCSIIYESNRMKFYCSSECKNRHRDYIITNCKPWNEYEKIRKKLYARQKNGSYTHRQHDEILNNFRKILNLYFQGKIDEHSALNRLETENTQIDSKFRYDKIYGDL